MPVDCAHDIDLASGEDHSVVPHDVVIHTGHVSAFRTLLFINATWSVLRIKLRSITIGLFKGRPEYSSALGPKRENDTVLKPRAVPVLRKDASAERKYEVRRIKDDFIAM